MTRLSRLAILAVKGASPGILAPLSKAIGVSKPTLYRYIDLNDDSLTKAAALKVIMQETGIKEDQLFEEDTVSQLQK